MWKRPGPIVSISYGGDTLIGRRNNLCEEKTGLARPLAGVRELFSKSDLSIVNLEAVISSKGTMNPNKVGNPYFYRGRPELVRILTEGGVGAVSLANNHAGDYGPQAIGDCLDLLRKAHIRPIGAGRNIKEARAPAYFDLKGTIVAIIGYSVQGTPRSGALKNRAGINAANRGYPDAFVKTMRAQVQRARRFANVVLLTVHWGPNNTEEPEPDIRELAKRLIREADVDGIFGSSAHHYHGIEIIDGRPVVYDAGNLFWDGGTPMERPSNRSAIFTFFLNQDGVSRVEAVPVELRACETRKADATFSKVILERLAMLSDKLGTKIHVQDRKAYVDIKREKLPPWPPKTIEPPKEPPLFVPTSDSYVPPVIVPALPEAATAKSVQFEDGIELLGFEIPPTIRKGHGIRVVTYWRAQGPLSRSYAINDRVQAEGAKRWGGYPHLPADWLYPTKRWRPGEIVQDDFFVRAPSSRSSEGAHTVSVEVYRGGIPIQVIRPQELAGSTAVVLGRFEAL